VTSFLENGRGVTVNGYVTNPTPTLTLTATLTKLVEEIQKETTLEIDQMT
jgi:hypothetical protein